jgi:hypothetical protein
MAVKIKSFGTIFRLTHAHPIHKSRQPHTIAHAVYPGRLDAAKMRSLLTELEGALRLSVKSEEPGLPDLSNLGKGFSYVPVRRL